MTRQRFLKIFLGLSLSLGLALASFAFLVKIYALPNLAALLPQETTESFVLLRDQKAWSLLDSPYAGVSWASGLGMAIVNGEKVDIVEINSSQSAKNQLIAEKTESETWKETAATKSLWSTVTCSSNPEHPCFTFIGDLLFFADTSDQLITIQKVAAGLEPSVEASSNYQNVRSRLAHWSSGWWYVDLQKTWPTFGESFSEFNSFLNIFTSFGAVLREDGSVQSFWGVDKTALQNAPYWHSTQKYAAELLPWTPDTLAFEWGGVDAAGELLHLQDLFNRASPELAKHFQTELQSFWGTWFGADFEWSTLQALLDDELYFGWTPTGENADFLVLAKLNSEQEIQNALALKDEFAGTARVARYFTAENGETQARFVAVEQSTGQYKNYQYYAFTAEGEEVATLIFTEQAAIVAGKQKTAFETLDRMLGASPLRSMDKIDSLLTGSNEYFSLHCLLLPDGSILKRLLSGVDSIVAGRKIFDDGSFARSFVQFHSTND